MLESQNKWVPSISLSFAIHYNCNCRTGNRDKKPQAWGPNVSIQDFLYGPQDSPKTNHSLHLFSALIKSPCLLLAWVCLCIQVFASPQPMTVLYGEGKKPNSGLTACGLCGLFLFVSPIFYNCQKVGRSKALAHVIPSLILFLLLPENGAKVGGK